MRRLLFAPLLFALALAVACSGDDGPEPTPTAPPPTATTVKEPTETPTPEPTATPVPRPEANPFPPDLQAEANGLLEQIAAVRGVALEEPVDMFLLTRDQARKFYDRGDDTEEAEAPEAEDTPGPTPTPAPRPLDPRQELYELLGLVPPRVEGTDAPDVEEQELDNLISIITGFYDDAYRAFYMIETINGGIFGPLARSTIVHELTHALQYQDVDIDAIAEQRRGNFDARTALLSVMEGEAVYTETQVLGFSTRSTYREPACFTIPAPMRGGTPYAVERELDVWYEDGFCFIQALMAQDPEAITRIFADVPQTMEQILHPEKYLAGEEAVAVDQEPLEGALGSDWRQLDSGVFGEFGLQNVLLTGLASDPERVQAAAAGWGGDAWNLYVSGDSRLIHMETAWDTEAEATEFKDGLIASLTARGATTSETQGATVTLTLEGVTWSLTDRGDAVTVLIGNDAAALDAATNALP